MKVFNPFYLISFVKNKFQNFTLLQKILFFNMIFMSVSLFLVMFVDKSFKNYLLFFAIIGLMLHLKLYYKKYFSFK